MFEDFADRLKAEDPDLYFTFGKDLISTLRTVNECHQELPEITYDHFKFAVLFLQAWHTCG